MPKRSPAERRRRMMRSNARVLAEIFRHRHEAGDKRALFDPIVACGKSGIPLPPWIVNAFEEGRRRVADMELGSWDEAFGRPWPKGRHLSQLRRRKRLKAMIHNEVSGSKTIPRSEAGFAQNGARHDISASQARELFYEAERDERELLDAIPTMPAPSKKFTK